jgi:hypothetical protein
MFGNPSIITGESAKMVAGINATALFFAPLTRTVPFNLFPPSIFLPQGRILLGTVVA